jgi:hypothetical protein
VQGDFVIQLHTDSGPGEPFRGRIEHIDSGRAGSFETLEELGVLLLRLLAPTGSPQLPKA